MSLKLNSQRELKAGDKVVVTIENAIHDCVVVSMVIQQRTFCGALLDTTKKNLPHGVVNFHDEETKTIETRKNASSAAELKRSHKTPFPQPLLTRHTYKQNVPQPPLRNIFRRMRRSRRNARINKNLNAKDSVLKNRHALPHKETGLSLSVSGKSSIDEEKQKTRKRNGENVLDAPVMKKGKESNSEDNSCFSESSASETMASPLKHLLPRKSIDCDTTPMQQLHTPAIKIKYKSPAGRGRIINIPSKPHNGNHLQPCSSATTIRTVKSKLASNKKLEFGSSKNAAAKKSSLTEKFIVSDASDKLQMMKRIVDVKIQHLTTGESGSESETKLLSNKYLVFAKHDSKKTRNGSETVQGSSKELLTQNHLKNKTFGKKSAVNFAKNQPKTFAKKSAENSAQNRRKKKAFAKKSIANRSIRSTTKQSTRNSFAASNCIEKRQLRIILQPLSSGKTDVVQLNAAKDNKNHADSTAKLLNSVKTSPSQSNVKKTPSPKSLTMYVTTCKDISGIIYAQGDVVWSKLAGYPWWPSKIIKLIVTKTDGEILQQEVMVAWFCSSTTSIIPLSCIQPFEKFFEIRFEKRRRGIYQKAVVEAKQALKKMSPEVRKLISQFET